MFICRPPGEEECAGPVVASFIKDGAPGSYKSESWNILYRRQSASYLFTHFLIINYQLMFPCITFLKWKIKVFLFNASKFTIHPALHGGRI